MKKAFTFLGALLLTSLIFSACGDKKTEEQNTTTTATPADNMARNEQTLRMANDKLYEALNAMFTGNLDTMNNVWAHEADITDLGPFGGRLLGWDSVYAEFKKNM